MQPKPLTPLLSVHAASRLLALRNALARALPDGLVDVVLFGSRARGDAHTESDYDVAVLLGGNLADDRNVCRQISDVVWEQQADDIIIQAMPFNAQALHAATSELAMRIAAEGVPIR